MSVIPVTDDFYERVEEDLYERVEEVEVLEVFLQPRCPRCGSVMRLVVGTGLWICPRCGYVVERGEKWGILR